MTILVPMSADEFARFAAESIPAYAADKVTSGEWLPDAAVAFARQAFEQLLPQGLATPGHHLLTIRAHAQSPAVGRLWYGVEERGGRRIAYVYDLHVAPEHRRHGHALRALQALEADAVHQGLAGIALHVFGHNLTAQALYAKLGFRPTDINLFKTVAQSGA